MPRLTSYGILVYKKDAAGGDIKYLLGKIPQGNFWTVFKGMPEANETPHETAIREFDEETGSTGVLTSISDDAPILYGQTSNKKDLVIFLQDGGDIISESIFNIDKVIKIDSGFMKGRPEIIDIRWLSLQQAMDGMDGAKIYNSQQTILQQAETILLRLRSDDE